MVSSISPPMKSSRPMHPRSRRLPGSAATWRSPLDPLPRGRLSCRGSAAVELSRLASPEEQLCRASPVSPADHSLSSPEQQAESSEALQQARPTMPPTRRSLTMTRSSTATYLPVRPVLGTMPWESWPPSRSLHRWPHSISSRGSSLSVKPRELWRLPSLQGR